MKTIYFVRHGESEANVDGLVAGKGFDSPLTELGKQQAQKAGEELRNKKVEVIVSSPQQRAKNTAEIIAEEIGLKSEEVITNELFSEQSYGIYEGKPATEFLEHLKSGRPIKGMELNEKLYTRAATALDWIKSLSQERILIVSHGSIGRMVKVVLQKLDHSHFHKIDKIGNAEIYEFEL